MRTRFRHQGKRKAGIAFFPDVPGATAAGRHALVREHMENAVDAPHHFLPSVADRSREASCINGCEGFPYCLSWRPRSWQGSVRNLERQAFRLACEKISGQKDRLQKSQIDKIMKEEYNDVGNGKDTF